VVLDGKAEVFGYVGVGDETGGLTKTLVESGCCSLCVQSSVEWGLGAIGAPCKYARVGSEYQG
jgi:hypothetical protein